MVFLKMLLMVREAVEVRLLRERTNHGPEIDQLGEVVTCDVASDKFARVHESIQ